MGIRIRGAVTQEHPLAPVSKIAYTSFTYRLCLGDVEIAHVLSASDRNVVTTNAFIYGPTHDQRPGTSYRRTVSMRLH